MAQGDNQRMIELTEIEITPLVFLYELGAETIIIPSTLTANRFAAT